MQSCQHLASTALQQLDCIVVLAGTQEASCCRHGEEQHTNWRQAWWVRTCRLTTSTHKKQKPLQSGFNLVGSSL
jgi:hypothetical protein